MLRFLITFPFLVVLVLFALDNKQSATLTFWPIDYQVTAPISAAILVALAAGCVLGALFVWFPSLSARSRARRYERATRRLEAQVSALKKKSDPLPAKAVAAR